MKPLPSRAWLIVGLLWLVALLNYLDRLMITTMREPIKEAIAMTDAQFGLLTSVFLWIYGPQSAGRLSRRPVQPPLGHPHQSGGMVDCDLADRPRPDL